ncbi:MAG: aminopeptidase [Spirochaetes bacterium]|nr:aminopeptidase [Spirochaetota bacterium]
MATKKQKSPKSPKPKKESFDHLVMKEESGWLNLNKKDLGTIDEFARVYIDFLNRSKTEREAVDYFIEKSQEKKFLPLRDVLKLEKIPSGSKVYAINHHKNIILAVTGKDPLEDGVNIICAHIDSPRLDLKQNPLYEDTGLAFLKTHYYGGIKKYHWFNIPLSIHGKVVKLDGKIVDITIGEKDEEPVFLIPDLLPHLSRKIADKKVSDAFQAENLNLIVGNIPVTKKDQKDPVKVAIMDLLNQKYGIVEADFNSSEIEIVPAMKAREAGLDASFIAGYGQDDRISSFAAFRALLDLEKPQRTTLVFFVDKEEIGSTGNSSIQSSFLEIFISQLVEKMKGAWSEKTVRMALAQSQAISADVDVAFDPNYKEVFDNRNTAKMGQGVIITKYTGHGGKYNTSDANAEYVGKLRRLFSKNNIVFQFGEMGKVDEGGGGTIAKFLAHFGMDIIDCGPPLLGMHSPYEISSKFDLYQTYKGYNVFLEKMR